MKLTRIMLVTGLLIFLAVSTVNAGRSLWLYPKQADGTDFVDAYVGKHEDPWLNQSYVIGADPFILEIYNHSRGKKHRNIAKNVFLTVAINNLDSFVYAKIGEFELERSSFTELEGTPELASGRAMPDHGIFPTWYAEVPIGDIAQNEAAQVNIEVEGLENLKVHFDAYGEGRPKKCKRKSHHKYYKGKSHYKDCKEKSYHKYYKGKKTYHKNCKKKVTCFHDVYNPFSHDVTVVVTKSEPLPVCGPDDISIVFDPVSLKLQKGDSGSFSIRVELVEGSNCNFDNAELVVNFPHYDDPKSGAEVTVFDPVFDEAGNQLENPEHIWTNVSLPLLKGIEATVNSSALVGTYEADAYLQYTSNNVEIDAEEPLTVQVDPDVQFPAPPTGL